jgi:hypothetical protein
MPESPFAREAFVAMGFHLCSDPMIPDRFEDGAVAVEDGVVAVGTGPGSRGRGAVDFGNDETYLHSLTALSSSMNGVGQLDSTPERRLSSHPTFYGTIT